MSDARAILAALRRGDPPTEADLTDSARHRFTELKGDYLSHQPMTDPRVGPYFTRYREIFSSHGLPQAAPADLKAFANNDIGAHPGNMSVFNRAWNELGDRAAADRVRGVIDRYDRYIFTGHTGHTGRIRHYHHCNIYFERNC